MVVSKAPLICIPNNFMALPPDARFWLLSLGLWCPEPEALPLGLGPVWVRRFSFSGQNGTPPHIESSLQPASNSLGWWFVISGGQGIVSGSGFAQTKIGSKRIRATAAPVAKNLEAWKRHVMVVILTWGLGTQNHKTLKAKSIVPLK